MKTNFRSVLIGFILGYFSLSSATLYAVQCDEAFPSVIQSHSSTGKLTLDNNVTVKNSPSTILPFSTAVINANNGDSCETADCSVDGSSSESLVLPNFPSFSGGVTFSGGNNTLGEGAYNTNIYRTVTVNSGTTNFSNNYTEYFIETLAIQNGSTLKLKPGTYWVQQLNLNSGTNTIEVEGSGTVYLYVRDSMNTGTSSQINGLTSTAALSLNVYSNLVVGANSSISGLIYINANTTVDNNAKVIGSLSTQDLRLNSGSTVEYIDDLFSRYDYSEICENRIDQQVGFYQFEQNNWSSSGDILDASEASNHGDPLGSISPYLNFSTQKSCHALEIDSNSSASVISAVDTGIDINSLGNDGSISFWYKSNRAWSGGGNRQLIDASTRSAGDKYFFLVLRSNGSLRFGLEYNGDDDLYSTTSNYSFAADEWVHIAITWNPLAAQLELYVNGNKAPTTDSIETPEGGTLDEMGTLYIGDNSTSYEVNGSTRNSANGYFDDFRVYNYIQDQAAIAADMQELSPCGLVTDYYFDEVIWDGTSGEVVDNSSSGLDGSALGDTATITAGKVCRAGTFDGTGDYINVSGISSILNTTASLSFWIKSSQKGNNTAWSAPGILGVEHRGGADDVFWGYLDASGHIRIQKGNGRSASSSTVISDDNWHHVVLTRNTSSGVVQVYVDGNLEDTANSTTGDISRAYSSIGQIKSSYSQLGFAGQLDELLIFDTVLPANYITSIYSNQLNGANYDGTPRVCPPPPIDHFEIQHDDKGFTCEAETMTIKACADESCSLLYDEETSITLSPSGWVGGDTLVFTGEATLALSVTDESIITLAKTSASVDVGLTCFIGTTETCEIEFVDSGFEFIGASTEDKFIPDQEAETIFQNVNLRAVEKDTDTGSCKAALVATTDIKLGYNCISPTPDKCLKPFSGITIEGDGTGESTGIFPLTFNAEGIAELTGLSYADAGRLELSAESNSGGKILKGKKDVDVYPSYLTLNVDETKLIYGSTGDQNNYIAGENFTFVIGAYGANNNLLPNYQAETPQLKIIRVTPGIAGENGSFKYSDSATRTSNGLFSNVPDISSSTNDDHFISGEYRFSEAYYSEVGRIEIDVKDANYLGNEVGVKNTLTLGDFYPAYFKVYLTEMPVLADTCNESFSYLGQSINFETSPEFTITAFNALNDVTLNYSDIYWSYFADELDDANLSFIDNSTYAADDSASVINLGDTPIIANNENFDGSGTVTINNSSFRYNKVDPDDKSVFAPVSPFDANINLIFASDFFKSTFVDQSGNQDTICYKTTFTDSTCLGWNINEVTGTQIRYGRLVLESTYGPETEPLNVPIKTEYFNTSQWLLNTDDSNCTSIDFTEDNDEIQLSDTSFANSFNSVTSTGVLIGGVAVGNQFTLDAPNTTGELDIWLNPEDENVTWPAYLNYDWNSDDFINTDDFPKATVTFGLFRGNDRIIHWREVFN